MLLTLVLLNCDCLQRKCTCQRKKKRCYCFRPNRNENWLFSRYSTGWKCGLHADWTELTGCVDQELDKNEGETAKRRYFYISLLRSPIPRYLSEFRHVQRGATWKNSRHFCLGRQATAEELPACYKGLHTFDMFEQISYLHFSMQVTIGLTSHLTISPTATATWLLTDRPECWPTWRSSTATTSHQCLCMNVTDFCWLAPKET